ncbi:Z1 domain-containing protein [Pontibacter sp. Tf4]|uniref:Z1 domain-containing protein n=1 Tax=Pontibacter sp. Tf4 TaxID=2761620 RepID=UPI0016268541|nr:Z1 domain-containing protein [Pontibacter sp. Tf4]MBB6611780.1 Z1 domain-containing protein [Pontibacter sp. Tf4]
MDTSKYIDVIKKLITSKARSYAVDNKLNTAYFDSLLPEIKAPVRTIADMYDYPEVDDISLENYYNIAVREFLSVHPIDIDPSSSLTKEGFQTWLTADRRNATDWNYSDRYFTYLGNTGRPEKVVEETRVSSLEILEKIGDPESREPFYIKGLVVGSVQSGKTGNFNAVINRAIDAGYGLIIVLSGIMEDLRSQTQLRIENDVVGSGITDLSAETKGPKGVGRIRRFGLQGDKSVDQVVAVTSFKSDFNKPLADADFSLDKTNILVCKKNVSVLRNLIVWLHDYLEEFKDKHNIPLLILDDEADNASLNNAGAKGREYASKTNGHIRALLDLFKRKTYLGYTATPFANVLQDRNEAPENDWVVKYKLKGESGEKSLSQVSNIFPDDFIVLLNPPSNYIGAKQIFETLQPIDNIAGEKIPLIEVVRDHTESFPTRVYRQEDGSLIGVENFENKEEWEERFGPFGGYLDFTSYQEYRKSTRASKSTDSFPAALPNSVRESIRCFVLSVAIRDSRKSSMLYSALYNPHHTMLVHISRYTSWQNATKKLVEEYIRKLQTDLPNDFPGNPDSVYAVFEKTWYRYYAGIIENISSYLPKGYQDEFLTPITFEALKNYLPDAIQDIEVKAINSVTNDKLEYSKKSPKKIIAIGGNRLSRGFTLEGLTINYFVRSTNYSDTLLQMGRWFGYRPGYLDCCKLFTTQDSIDKFDATTRTIEELEAEFRKMEAKNKTPENFVLRVRKHPGTLKITRPSILKNAKEVKWSYQDQLEQTTRFDVRKEKILKVWTDFKNGIAGSLAFSAEREGFLTCSTDIPGILRILQLENNFDEDVRNGLIRFIELCREKGKLSKWTIAVKTRGNATAVTGKGTLKAGESNLPVDVNLSVRKGPSKDNSSQSRYRDIFLYKKSFSASGRSANIISGGKDLSLLLSKSQISEAEAEFIQEKKTSILRKDPTLSEAAALAKAEKTTVPERVYRERMTEQEGLLVIYLFDAHYVFLQEKGSEDPEFRKMVEDEGYDLDIPLVGYAIGFPPIKDDPGGIYMQGDYDLDTDDESGEEEAETDSEVPDDIKELI